VNTSTFKFKFRGKENGCWYKDAFIMILWCESYWLGLVVLVCERFLYKWQMSLVKWISFLKSVQKCGKVKWKIHSR